ncbi:MAG: hypothetical protein ACQEP1_03980 [Nanobdellota archaeon]
MGTYETLKVILKKNFGAAGVKYLDGTLKKNNIQELDSLPLYLQERIVDQILSRLLNKIFPKDKVRDFEIAVMSQIFGKKQAIKFASEKMTLKHPPMEFMEGFFGSELGKQIKLIEKRKNSDINIELMEKDEQIEFIKETLENIDPKIKTAFAKYLQEGFDKRIKDHIREDKTLICRISEYLEKNGLEEKVALKRLLNSMKNKEELLSYI